MSEQLLTILKLCLLALLYLFFFRVVRAVWAELRSAGATTGGAVAAPARPAAAPPAAAAPKRRARGVPTELVATDPPNAAAHELAVPLAPVAARPPLHFSLFGRERFVSPG